MRRILTFLFAALMSVGMWAAPIVVERVQIGDLYYNLNNKNKTAEVTYKSYTNWKYNEGWDITTANIPASVEYYSVTYSVTSIGESAFQSCSDLTSVTIPNSVTSIGVNAFYKCSDLTSIEIPSGVTSVGNYAFSNCTGLTSVTIPNGVTSIGTGAFMRCSNLESVTIPNGVTSIEAAVFGECTALTSIEIPNSVEYIDEQAFAGCTGLTSVTIGNSVESIGGMAFAMCTGLTSIEIPNSVEYIGEGAFWGCTGLTSVTIGNSVTSIGEMAFAGCTGLETVTNYATTPQNIESKDVFGEVDLSSCTLYVPEESESAYSTASVWQDFGTKSAIPAAADVTLTDGDGITALSSHTGQTITVAYTRSFTAGTTSTVCLPFAYTKKEGDGSFYAFTNIEKEGSEYVATMTEPAATTLTANTPYLYMPIATGNVDFGGAYTIPTTLTAGSTTSNGWTFKGTFTTIEWTTAPTGTYGFSAQSQDGISQGQFVKVGDYVKIKPMRCYLENESFAGARGANRAAEQLPETIKVRLIGANGEVTGIGTISTKTGEGTIDNGAWYSLDGRRIVGKPSVKGVYVKNGQKIVIK